MKDLPRVHKCPCSRLSVWTTPGLDPGLASSSSAVDTPQWSVHSSAASSPSGQVAPPCWPWSSTLSSLLQSRRRMTHWGSWFHLSSGCLGKRRNIQIKIRPSLHLKRRRTHWGTVRPLISVHFGRTQKPTLMREVYNGRLSLEIKKVLESPNMDYEFNKQLSHINMEYNSAKFVFIIINPSA